MDAGVEIGVAADPRRQVHRAIGCAGEQQRLHAFDLAPLGAVGIEQFGQARPQRPARSGADREQTVEPRPAGGLRRPLRLAGEQPRLARDLEVEDRVADGDAAARLLARLIVDAERQVLDRKVRMAVGALDPAPAFGVMRRVDHQSPNVQGSSHITECCNNAPQMTPPGQAR
jgi:hypothetical protein